jgi:hypothetical protein
MLAHIMLMADLIYLHVLSRRMIAGKIFKSIGKLINHLKVSMI